MSQKRKYIRKSLIARKPVSMMEFLKQVQSIVWAKRPKAYCQVRIEVGQHIDTTSRVQFNYSCYFHGGSFYDGATPQEAISKMKDALSRPLIKPQPADAIV